MTGRQVFDAQDELLRASPILYHREQSVVRTDLSGASRVIFVASRPLIAVEEDFLRRALHASLTGKNWVLLSLDGARVVQVRSVRLRYL
ncbi:MAG: hypothetical protein PVSMB1_14000 [Gemmatimonadaceae bacterium]